MEWDRQQVTIVDARCVSAREAKKSGSCISPQCFEQSSILSYHTCNAYRQVQNWGGWELKSSPSELCSSKQPSRALIVLEPIPGIFRSGSGNKTVSDRHGYSTFKDFGFLKSEASLARSGLTDMPKEVVKPVCWRM